MAYVDGSSSFGAKLWHHSNRLLQAINVDKEYPDEKSKPILRAQLRELDFLRQQFDPEATKACGMPPSQLYRLERDVFANYEVLINEGRKKRRNSTPDDKNNVKQWKAMDSDSLEIVMSKLPAMAECKTKVLRVPSTSLATSMPRQSGEPSMQRTSAPTPNTWARLDQPEPSHATAPMQSQNRRRQASDDRSFTRDIRINDRSNNGYAQTMRSQDTRPSYHQEAPQSRTSAFLTARQQLQMESNKKHGNGKNSSQVQQHYQQNRGNTRGDVYDQSGGASRGRSYSRGLGLSRPRGGNNPQYIPPVKRPDDANEPALAGNAESEAVSEKAIKSVDDKLVELIKNEIMEHNPNISWDDIAGLEYAKQTIQEIVIWPMQCPELFTGLRASLKGLLLFGPPGTGKTLIGKCIASQCDSTFFSISASSLTSKWIGEGEKLVRVLFAVARMHLPAVIFIDEIDSLLSKRTDDENEASRRIKTEFLVQLDGATTTKAEQLLIIGATNRPQELDDAARRRLAKRLYIPLPDSKGRNQLVRRLLKDEPNELSDEDYQQIVSATGGFSGADIATLCGEAAREPIRNLMAQLRSSGVFNIHNVRKEQVPPLKVHDFQKALTNVKPSVANEDLKFYEDWNERFGSKGT